MPHLNAEELMATLRAARKAGEGNRGNPSHLKRHRELVEACPAFAPNLIELARLLLLTEESGVSAEQSFDEVQRLLEQAVQASDRGATALIELAYFLDTIRDSPDKARILLEEGAAKALKSLEDAWAGLINLFCLEDQLPQALELSARAEKIFPDSGRIMGAVADARQSAIAAGLLPPDTSDS
jgi:hypothetical protein